MLFVHASDELYGSDRCLLEIVRNLPTGYRAVVVLPTDVPHPGKLTPELERAGATVLHRRMLVLRRSLLKPRHVPGMIASFVAGTWTLFGIARREKAALVHSNTIVVVCGAFAAMIARRPHLWHVHEFLGDEPVPIRVALRLLLRFVPGAIVANSRATARSTRVSRTTVVENAVFTDTAIRRTNGNKPLTIGYVGRLSPRKGIAETLQAAASLRDRGMSFQLLIAGGPPPGQPELLREYDLLAGDLGISAIARFLGQRDDLPEIYTAIDILLVPSQRPEPFGLAIVESMAAGCAVVATRNGGGSDEILTDGTDGIYCDPDPESIADALQRLIDHPDLRNHVVENARITASTRFDRGRYVAEIHKTYSKLGA